jgi:hypothetical protein
MSPYESMYGALFGARKSIRYHQRRRAFFEGAHTVAVTLQVIAGSSAVAAVVGNSTALGASLAATAAVLAALDLTFGMSRRATAHASLAQQFAQLEREMVPYEHDENVDAATATGFRQRRLEIEESEPPKLRVIDLLCHNELVTSTYRHEKIYPIGPVRRCIGHVLDIEVADILARPKKVTPLV